MNQKLGFVYFFQQIICVCRCEERGEVQGEVKKDAAE